MLCFGFSMRRMLLTLMFCFSCCYEIKDFFPVSHIQLRSRWGAGREHSQVASPSWPSEIFHIMDIMLSLWMGIGWGGRNLFFIFPWVWILSWLGVQTFPGVWFFLGVSWNSWFPDSAIAAQGLAANLSLGGEKNCIVYSLFYIFIINIIIIIIISINISIFFVVLLNCFYPSPQLLPFVHISLSCVGGREGWASGCLVLSSWLPG